MIFPADILFVRRIRRMRMPMEHYGTGPAADSGHGLRLAMMDSVTPG